MAKARRSAVRGSYLPLVMMAVAVGMLGLSGVAVAWTLGAFDSKPASQPVDHTGQLAFPAIVRPVGAYEALTKDDFINPQTKQLNVVWLPEATAQVASRNMAELIGRVLRRDKLAGMVLTESDFMEKGTRPGLVAGIPAGKFAMSIPASGIPGLEQLRGGDRFDLLVSLPKRDGEELLSNSEPAALFGGIKPPSLRVGQLSRQHGVKHLVTNGMLVNLFSGAKRSTSGPTGLTVAPSNSRTKSTTTQTVFAELAVDPEEIGPLTEAISMGTKMTCILRSGLPGGDVDDVISTDGMVPVITTATQVNAFAALTDENLMDESTGQLHFYYFAPDKISGEWITDPAELYGRVVARPLRRGAFITENDLLPPGTRPGVSAGLQSGMAGMSLSKSIVQGFEKLSVGDTFSILTRVPGEITASTPTTTWATLQGGQLSPDDARVSEMVRTGIREVVRNAIFLSELDHESVIIGIPQMEVAKLAQLIRDKVEVFAVARSSQQEFDSANNANRFPTASRSHLFSGSAWEHTVSEALPPLATFVRGAYPVVRSQAGASERGNPILVAQIQSSSPFEKAQRRGEKIPVPILVQDVPAFEELSIDDFIDPTTGRVQTLYFDQANIDADWELDIRKLIDRVALRRLRSGRPVLASDLAPPGSPAGPALGLDPGMRAVTVNAAQLVGLETLRVGTEFDVVSARGVEVNSLANTVRQSIASSDAVREASKLPGGKVAASRTIATHVKLLTNVGTVTIIFRKDGGVKQTQSQTRLTADGQTTTETLTFDPIAFEERTVSQFVLAVPEEFVGSLLGLLDHQNPLYVSLRPVSETSSPNQPSVHNQVDPPVRAVIQEHVRGGDVDSEVFLTDRAEPLAMASKTTVEDASPSEDH